MLNFLFFALSFLSSFAHADVSGQNYFCQAECAEQIRKFTSTSIFSLQGKWLLLPQEAFGSQDPQKIFLLSAISPAQRHLVRRLAILSVDSKLIQATRENRESGVEQVEVGAFRVVFKDGHEVYDIHTSNKVNGITEESINRSFKRLCKTKKFDWRDVTVFEYYHTHPFGSNTEAWLSSFDANFIKSWLLPKMRIDNSGTSIPVNLYAISQTFDGHLVVSMSSYE